MHGKLKYDGCLKKTVVSGLRICRLRALRRGVHPEAAGGERSREGVGAAVLPAGAVGGGGGDRAGGSDMAIVCAFGANLLPSWS